MVLDLHKKIFPKHPYFWGSPYGWPVRELVQIISRYVIKKLDKIFFLILDLFYGKLSTNVYIISTCFAEIMASNGSLSSFWYFHFPWKRCSQAFRDHDFSQSSFDSQHQENRKYDWIIKISKYYPNIYHSGKTNMFFQKWPDIVDDTKQSSSL